MKKLLHRPRGFVIIIVLAAAAAITAVVAAQLLSAQKGQVIGTRATEEVRARGIAEACLAMMTTYAQQFDPDAGVGDDFDRILAGPDATAYTGDDYLPFGNTREVIIPENASALAGDALNRHQWNLMDVPGSGGVCAVRFDDNSDDGKPPSLGAPFPEAAVDAPGCGGENGGTENYACDADRAVYVTVIGMYPLLTGTADADAYERAHARVTMRRLVQMPSVVQPRQPALWGNTVNIGNSTEICGFGGVTGGTVTFGSTACACGQTVADPGQLNNPPQVGDTCTCPNPPGCIPAQPGTGATPPAPTWVHWANVVDDDAQDTPPAQAILDGEGWGPAHRVPNPLAAGPDGENSTNDPADANSIVGNALPAPICAFYADAAKQIFVWDAGDTSTRDTLQVQTGLGQRHSSVVGGAIDGDIPDDNCSAGGALHDADPLPEPCTWNQPGGAGTPFTSLTCTAGQSPCWKLLTKVNGWLDDTRLGGAASPWSWPSNEWLTGGPGFHPNKNVPIMNVRNGRHFGPGANSLCGDQTGGNCSSCTTFYAANPGGPVIEANGHWDFETGSNNANSPSPSVWIVREYGGQVHVKNVTGNPWRATVISDATLKVDAINMCCATCDCSNFTSLGSMHLTNSFGALDGTAVGMVGANPNMGIVLKAITDIDIGNGTTTVGDIRARSVDFANGASHLGAIVGYGTGAAGSCGSGTCNPAHVCFNNSGAIAGDVHSMSSIDIKNNPKLFGNVVAKANVCIGNTAELDGNIMAGGTIDVGNAGKIVSTSSSTVAATVQVTQQLTTYFEALW
ncbi:MAG: hypothetical protein IT383_11050 [Deltaproteobacteria bacterium]|nr:hypothetical protein [Deltaproteobacteria bacterium]